MCQDYCEVLQDSDRSACAHLPALGAADILRKYNFSLMIDRSIDRKYISMHFFANCARKYNFNQFDDRKFKLNQQVQPGKSKCVL